MMAKYVQVYTANGMLEAESIRLFLESLGMDAFISQESAGVTFGLTVGPLGEARIFVPAEQAEKAVAALKEMEEGRLSGFEEEGPGGEDQEDQLNDQFE